MFLRRIKVVYSFIVNRNRTKGHMFQIPGINNKSLLILFRRPIRFPYTEEQQVFQQHAAYTVWDRYVILIFWQSAEMSGIGRHCRIQAKIAGAALYWCIIDDMHDKKNTYLNCLLILWFIYIYRYFIISIFCSLFIQLVLVLLPGAQGSNNTGEGWTISLKPPSSAPLLSSLGDFFSNIYCCCMDRSVE